mgnify:CR=1 FL=1
MQTNTIIGSLAAIMTTLAFVPQAIKVVKTRDTKSISLWMYIIFSTGVALWLVYGLMKNDLPIILANMVTLVFALIILFYKLIEKN